MAFETLCYECLDFCWERTGEGWRISPLTFTINPFSSWKVLVFTWHNQRPAADRVVFSTLKVDVVRSFSVCVSTAWEKQKRRSDSSGIRDKPVPNSVMMMSLRPNSHRAWICRVWRGLSPRVKARAGLTQSSWSCVWRQSSARCLSDCSRSQVSCL